MLKFIIKGKNRMEPSIRSSSMRVKENSLQKCIPALQDTAKRFVESLSNDVRISQYADLDFAMKKIENNKWYWLEPLSSGRQGFLLFLPNQPVVWMDDQMKFCNKIPIRVSPALTKTPSLFLASLSRSENILRIEDCWQLSGISFLKTPFTQRWNKVNEFFSNHYHFDSHLQQGLSVVPAVYTPLSQAKEWNPLPQMMLAQGETYPRRLRVQITKPTQTNSAILLNPTSKSIHHNAKPYVKQEGNTSCLIVEERYTPKQSFVKPTHNKNKTPPSPSVKHIPKQIVKKEIILNDQIDDLPSNIAKAIPHPEYPDTYDIWMNGKKKGYAAVQDLELSQLLRKQESKEMNVNVEWNPEFSMFEITKLIN